MSSPEVLNAAGTRLEAALASDPDNQDTRLHVGWVWCNLGEVYQRAATRGSSSGREADWVKAGRCYQRAVDTLSALKGEGRPDLDIDPRRMVARSEAGLAACRKHQRERSGQ